MSIPLITAHPDILGGLPVFGGTRVPVKNFTDCLEAGENIDDFLSDFPTVRREQLIAFLESAHQHLTAALA